MRQHVHYIKHLKLNKACSARFEGRKCFHIGSTLRSPVCNRDVAP